MAVDRRAFLKTLATASAAAATSGIAPGPAYAAASHAAGVTRAPTWAPAPCRLCGVGCGLLVGVENGRAVAARGNAASGTSRGMACVKGYHAVQTLYGQDRLQRAMLRRDGVLVEVPIGQALDAVAVAMRATIGQHGKDSVAIYGSAQWTIQDAYVASKFLKGAIGTNNIESSTRVHSASAIAGLAAAYGADGGVGCYEDVDHADVVVLWDTNLAESDPVLFSRILDRRRADPAVRIVDITTRTTRTSYGSDRSIVHRPHATFSIASAVAREIIDRGWMQRAFVAQHVAFRRGVSPDASAGDGLMDSASDDATLSEYAAFLAPFSAEQASRDSGVPADAIRWLASLYGDRSRRVVSVWGAGVHRTANSLALNNALHNLHLLVGKFGAPGNTPLVLTGQPGGGGEVHDAGTLTHTLPRGVVSNQADRHRAAEIWGVPAAGINATPSAPVLSMFQALETGTIRFLWIQATNPMLSLPNAARYRRAAQRNDRFIVVTDAYPTPTTDVADVVLPAALWIERDGVAANAERRLQAVPALVSPPGDAAGDAWHMIEVAHRLGYSNLFPWDRRTHAEEIWEEYRRFYRDGPDTLPSYDELRAGPGAHWPFVGARGTARRFSTQDDPAADASRGAVHFYRNPDGRAHIWMRPTAPPAEAPDAAFPFWLETGPVLEHWGGGTLTRRIPTLHRSIPQAYIELSRDDATRLGIRDGDRVRLASRRGSIDIQARVDYRAQPPRGLVFVPSFDEGHPIHRLTLDAQCPLSGQPESGPCAVSVERLPARDTP